MEGKLKIKRFEDVNPREKYFVLYDNNIHRVISLKKDKVQLENVDKAVSRSEITPIKLKIQVDKMLCDLLFDDYYKLDEVKEDMIIEGNIVKFKQKSSEGDTVTISALNIVDKYGLYDHNSRYGTVHSIEKTHHVILMNKNNVEIRCKRSDYKIVNMHDEQRLFHIPCPKCRQ